MTYVLRSGWGCGAVVEFVAGVVVVVPVVAPSGRCAAVASPRPAVADPRVSRGTTWAAAWRPATVRMNILPNLPILPTRDLKLGARPRGQALGDRSRAGAARARAHHSASARTSARALAVLTSETLHVLK